MLSITNPHPLSLILFRRNKYYSPKLYLKESYLRRREKLITSTLIAVTGALGGILALLAGFNLFINHSLI